MFGESMAQLVNRQSLEPGRDKPFTHKLLGAAGGESPSAMADKKRVAVHARRAVADLGELCVSDREPGVGGVPDDRGNVEEANLPSLSNDPKGRSVLDVVHV
jgi:hypothetical protein